jgi:hypothetical protein
LFPWSGHAHCTGFLIIITSVEEPEPRAEDPKLNACRSRSRNDELRPCFQFPLLSIYQRLKEILKKKIMVAEEVFVNCYNFNPVTKVKKR